MMDEFIALMLNVELEKAEHSDLQIEYRRGNATIKVLDQQNGDKPKIIVTADLIQCKTIITFKDTATAKRCRFCQTKLTDKNRVQWMQLSEKQKLKEQANDTEEKKEDAEEEKKLSVIYEELSTVPTMVDVCNDETFCVINATQCSRYCHPCG